MVIYLFIAMFFIDCGLAALAFELPAWIVCLCNIVGMILFWIANDMYHNTMKTLQSKISELEKYIKETNNDK